MPLRFGATARAAQAIKFFSSHAAVSAAELNFRWASARLAPVSNKHRVKHVMNDGAGTVFDEYCIAPFYVFNSLFSKRGFQLTHAQITGPMGIKKIEHIRHLLKDLTPLWQRKYNRAPHEGDVVQLHDEFMSELDEIIPDFSKPTPHVDKAYEFAERHSMTWSLTSGYSRKTIEVATKQFNKRFPFNVSTTADEVADGSRIAMIEKNLLMLQGMIPASMGNTIFFTDAVSDVRNVRAAKKHPWIIGVCGYSTHVGITSLAQASAISPAELNKQQHLAKMHLLENGAHSVIHNMGEASLAILAATHANFAGQSPETTHTLAIRHPLNENSPFVIDETTNCRPSF